MCLLAYALARFPCELLVHTYMGGWPLDWAGGEEGQREEEEKGKAKEEDEEQEIKKKKDEEEERNEKKKRKRVRCLGFVA